MILPRRVFRDLLLGRATVRVVVASLPTEIAAQLSANTSDVWLARDYALKLRDRHNVGYENLRLVQAAIDHGHCLLGKADNHLEFIYFDDQNSNRPWLLVIKSARWGQEVWLVSLYRTHRQQIQSKLRRHRMLREHRG